MSPYPPGLELPEAAKRPSCAEEWPPVLAPADAKPIGAWTIVDRPDGRKQWAYEGYSLYTSMLDKQPGDVLGTTNLLHISNDDRGFNGVVRRVVGPKPNVPAQFAVYTTITGRSVELHEEWSVYSYDGDARNKSNCYNACLDGWEPTLAGSYASPIHEWTTFERAPGVWQWAFRGRPMYRHLTDRDPHSQDGADVPQWHNVYTQMAPKPPQSFKVKITTIGDTLGDEHGKTIYEYRCTDDALDQLLCDYPEAPQIYRFTVCGGGDPDRCAKTFPYVIAPKGAKTGNQVWGTMYVDPKTGKRATADQPNALNVWTFRGRPLYTFAGRNNYGDKTSEDTNANGWGEFGGRRNGFHAIVYRNVF
ncbi:MAG: hypothetical protein EXR86_16250 [Gammaproteobacteria bacterium]|nr:hypothetical protein [Gammaproteobacteria bacterium]